MKVYFAHPSFTDSQRTFKERFLTKLRPFLATTQITLIDPFEHIPIIEGDPERTLTMAEDIMIECLKLLEGCDVVMALVDDNDTGTAFEIGYAHAVGKPIILISETTCAPANAMLIGAAKVTIDTVLDDMQMNKLVRIVEWFEATISKYPGKSWDSSM
mgnify:CR=1 FL=1